MAPQTLTKLNVSGLCHLAQIGLVAVLLVAVAPQVAGAQDCTSPAQFSAIAHQYQGVTLLADLPAPADFLRDFNAIPPVSHITAERVLIFRRPGVPRDLVGFFEDGCLNIWATPVRELIDRTLGEFL